MSTKQSPRGEATIDVRIREIRQLFNSLDATPFPETDLDADAEEFIVGWAMELPSDAKLRLRIFVSQSPTDPQHASQLQAALHNYFQYRAGVIQRQFRRLLARGRLSLVIGLSCLAASVFGAEMLTHLGKGAIVTLVKESLLVGGWVAMWMPLQIFLYDWWPLRHHRRVCERLSMAEVELIAASPPAGASSLPSLIAANGSSAKAGT